MSKKGEQIIHPVLQVLFVIAMLHCLGLAVAAGELPDPASHVLLTDAVGKFPLGARLAYLEDPSVMWDALKILKFQSFEALKFNYQNVRYLPYLRAP